MFFDEHSRTSFTLAVESFGHLGREVGDLIEQLAATIVEGTGGGVFSEKRCLQGATLPGFIGDQPGRDLAPGALVQACPARPPGRLREKGGRRMTTSYGVGV